MMRMKNEMQMTKNTGRNEINNNSMFIITTSIGMLKFQFFVHHYMFH